MIGKPGQAPEKIPGTGGTAPPAPEKKKDPSTARAVDKSYRFIRNQAARALLLASVAGQNPAGYSLIARKIIPETGAAVKCGGDNFPGMTSGGAKRQPPVGGCLSLQVSAQAYSATSITTPEPTVRPFPTRQAARGPLWISMLGPADPALRQGFRLGRKRLHGASAPPRFAGWAACKKTAACRRLSFLAGLAQAYSATSITTPEPTVRPFPTRQAARGPLWISMLGPADPALRQGFRLGRKRLHGASAPPRFAGWAACKKTAACRRLSFVAGLAQAYSATSITTPEPTVRPPSRMAKRRPFSMAMGVISSTFMSTLSPGIHISVPSGRVMTPVTSVVRK